MDPGSCHLFGPEGSRCHEATLLDPTARAANPPCGHWRWANRLAHWEEEPHPLAGFRLVARLSAKVPWSMCPCANAVLCNRKKEPMAMFGGLRRPFTQWMNIFHPHYIILWQATETIDLLYPPKLRFTFFANNRDIMTAEVSRASGATDSGGQPIGRQHHSTGSPRQSERWIPGVTRVLLQPPCWELSFRNGSFLGCPCDDQTHPLGFRWWLKNMTRNVGAVCLVISKNSNDLLPILFFSP